MSKYSFEDPMVVVTKRKLKRKFMASKKTLDSIKSFAESADASEELDWSIIIAQVILSALTIVGCVALLQFASLLWPV